jgi:hypothetical protein
MILPIIVVSSYRSGSTAYSCQLANQHNLDWFSEPHKTDKHLIKFEEIYNNSTNKFVIKFMADQISEYYPYQALLNSNCYKIKLFRRNIVDQIVSAYIASVTNVWHHGDLNGNNRRGAEPIRIDVDLIKHAVAQTLECVNKLNQLDYTFDEIVYYEDIRFIENSRNISKLPEPSNINEIRELVLRYYKNE